MDADLENIGKMAVNNETFYIKVQYLEPQNHFAQHKEAAIKEDILYGFINMKCPKKASMKRQKVD